MTNADFQNNPFADALNWWRVLQDPQGPSLDLM